MKVLVGPCFDFEQQFQNIEPSESSILMWLRAENKSRTSFQNIVDAETSIPLSKFMICANPFSALKWLNLRLNPPVSNCLKHCVA